jgi:hypothetical protein
VDNAVIERPTSSSTTKNKIIKQNLCLDRAYNSKLVEHEIVKRGYVPHIRYKRKRGERKDEDEKAFKKRYHSRRWVVERTNSA